MKAKLAVRYGHVFRNNVTTRQRSCMCAIFLYNSAAEIIVDIEDDAESLYQAD